MTLRLRLVGLAGAALLVVTAAVAVLAADQSRWILSVFLVLLVLVVAGDLLALERERVSLSGNFLGIILAMALLGPVPAALLGVLSNFAWVWRVRPRLGMGLMTIASYAVAPLAGALVLRELAPMLGVSSRDLLFAVPLLAAFAVMHVTNFVLVFGAAKIADGRPFWRTIRSVIVPLLPSELAMVLLASLVIFAEARLGPAALAMLVALFLLYLYLYRELLRSEERREELVQRNDELSALQVGTLTALLRTLSLRDRMTARHSAAVARYARALAGAHGCSEAEQELVHISALLHDIGKFILPDHVLLADSKPTEEDWRLIRMHPYQGARIVHELEGYGPVADIVLAHHERIDGAGYPRGIPGEEIPLLSKMISIADTYDVMTSRDSYREPVSSVEAVAELRRVAGAQLDAELVEAFVRVLDEKGVAFRHGDDADFELELAFEQRVREHAAPRPAPRPVVGPA